MTLFRYLLTAVAVTSAIRILPMLLIRKPITNHFIRSFLFYVPYVTLSVMLFPAMIYQTGSVLTGALAMGTGVFIAWKKENLFLTVAAVCAVSLILAYGLPLLSITLP